MLRFTNKDVDKMKKNTKKADFIVDLTDIEDINDIKFEVIRGKAIAGVKITDDDIYFLVKMGSMMTCDLINDAIDNLIENQVVTTINDPELINDVKNLIENRIAPKKEPWYKRFWKWLKKPFTKSK